MARSPEEPDPAPSGAKRALLVGIRTYPSIPKDYGSPLAGCHNDAARMREVLLERGFDDGGVRVLVDRMEGCDCPFCAGELPVSGPPTREGIVSAVRELVDAAGPDDVVVVYYSGHGSEFSGRGLFAGQRFQTIVPNDSGRGSFVNRDLTDREIEGWIRDFCDKTPYLTMIFDCCHSGGMTDLRGGALVGRQVKADEREDAGAFDPELRKVLEPAGDAPPARGPSGWLRGAGRSAIVLSASAAKELSSETVVGDRKQGLFTHQLTTALRRETGARTWADVFPGVAAAVTAENLSQHPRREGNAPIFERGEIDPDDVYPPDVVELTKFAVVVGIDYAGSAPDRPGFPALKTPKRDAEEIARVLAEVQGYEIVGLSRKSSGPLLNEKATRQRIHKVIDRLVDVKARTQRETAVVIYFAGHGVVRTGDDGTQVGYLVPWGAEAEDPETWLPMQDLRDQLVDGIHDAERLERIGLTQPLGRVTSRHLLLVLDCCFGGALAFDFFRGGGAEDRPIYYSEYKRFVEGTAWQLLTSASYNQQAMDRNPKDPGEVHSPFARALIDALTTAEADSFRLGSRSDQIVTAAELGQFVDARLKKMGVDVQTPGLTALRPLHGQFIFHVPGFRPSPLPDPPLDPAANPWRGEEAYRAGDEEDLFHGREMATLGLLDLFLAVAARPSPSESAARAARDGACPTGDGIAVAGPSGCGKTSLVRAGLLPILDDPVRARRRLRSWLGRAGRKEYLVTEEDLRAVRNWAAGLALADHLDDPEALSDKVRKWAREAGLAAETGTGPAQVRDEMARQNVGMPSFEETSGEAEGLAWLNRLGLLKLLDSPGELAERLRLWLKEGGVADFLSLPDQAQAEFFGRWKVVAEGEDSERVLLSIDEPERERRLTVTTVRSDLLARLPELSRGMRIYRVPGPTRDELFAVVTRPAAARVLDFEPPEMVDALVEEVVRAPVPLALLSATLAETYARAWARRRDADRLLTAADFPPEGAAGLVAGRAESVYQRLLQEDPKARSTFRSLLLRAVSFDHEGPAIRPVPWRELELDDPDERRRLDDHILPALLRERVMVADDDHVELACASLAGAWKRLGRWIREAGKNPVSLLGVFRRALEWEESGFDRRKLWAQDPVVAELFRSTALNRLERAFVVASEMERRTMTAVGMAVPAHTELDHDWPRCALLGAEMAALAIDTGNVAGQVLGAAPPAAEELAQARKLAAEARYRTWEVAEQTLQDVLGVTPFSVPLSLPEEMKISGLGFRGDDEIRIRFAGGVLSWNLEELSEKPRLLAESEPPGPGDGLVATASDGDFVAVPQGPGRHPKAQPGRDNAVRFFTAEHLEIFLKPGPFDLAPTVLLGHRGVPAFLAFSESRAWLASAANAPAGPEVRLWPIRERGLPCQPQTHDSRLEDLDGFEAETSAEASGGTSWRIDEIAADGSSFVLHDLGTGHDRTAELPAGSSLTCFAFSPDGRRLAVGCVDGCVEMWPDLSGIGYRPVVLSRRGEGFAVRSLAFDRRGRHLAVERRATFPPHRLRVDVYRVDLEELALLARGHAGRRLARTDLPPELRDGFSTAEPDTDEKVRYHRSLGLSSGSLVDESEPQTTPREEE